MAQQIFDKHWPLGKNGANELIPGAAILQTRDGKDEPITLAASFQIGESGLFLPTSKDNPLEVRVRQLEAELQQLRQLLQNGDAQVTLTGQLPAGAETIGGVTFQGSRAGEIEYILNAVSVPPGGNTGYIPLDYKGCRKVILGVQSSQPWRIDTNTPWGTASDGHSALFSTTDLSQVQSPVTSGNYPRLIVVGYRIGGLDIQEYAFAEVLGLAILPPNLRVRVENLSPDSVSTVSVRIMRIW